MFCLSLTVIGAPGFYDHKSKTDVEREITRIKSLDAYKTKSKSMLDIQFDILTKLIDKDTSNLSYNELKKIVYDVVEKSNFREDNKDGLKRILVVKVCDCSRFRKYVKDVVNDEELKDNSYVRRYYTSHYRDLFSTSKLLEIYKSFLIGSTRSKDFYKKNSFKKHKEIINKLSPEEALKELKYIKRYTYPLIADEEWKKIVVEVELMIKSLE